MGRKLKTYIWFGCCVAFSFFTTFAFGEDPGGPPGPGPDPGPGDPPVGGSVDGGLWMLIGMSILYLVYRIYNYRWNKIHKQKTIRK
ncbi:MAG: hypothetical protein Q8867_08215 [Bacteroidota bacterium]|nr:hypothetical protein [Bacteroidota bacterium]